MLGGNGTIAANVTVQSGGTLDPGDVSATDCTPLAGKLTVNGNVDLQPGGTFRVQLGGLTAGVGGYDQLALNGSLDLHGNSLGVGGGSLSTVAVGGFRPPVGSEFRIVDKVSAGTIETRFAGLPEVSFLSLGGVLINILYRAGDNNNDVVLAAPGRYDFNGFHGYTADELHRRVAVPVEDRPATTAGWQIAAAAVLRAELAGGAAVHDGGRAS